MPSAAAAAAFVFGYWLLVCRERGAARRPAPRYETRKWLGSLVPLSLVTAASLINSRLDILMLGSCPWPKMWPATASRCSWPAWS